MQIHCRTFRELIDSTSGVGIIETAIVIPMLTILIMGTVDVAAYGAAKLTVQQGINRGLEMVMMGGADTSTTAIRDETAAQADVSSGQVIVTQSQTCGGTTATWGTTCASGQELRRFIHITATATFTPTFVGGSLAQLYGDADGNIAISSTGVIRIR